ncbi:MAG: DUF362 domain-containing protein [Candidatus Cloacimonetes bacterium]|nr:DUF362 domain-containing protein [Candidatus Cloacimonadota bacterium]
MAIVYYSKAINAESVWKIYEKIAIEKQGRLAIKLHFGERGNRNYLDPALLYILASRLDAVLVETNVLYLGPRRETATHLSVAKEHGFDFAPLHILDAEGDYSLPYQGLSHFSEVRLPLAIDEYDGYIIYSHFKGHIMTGFGGAIKNVGMGMASIPGKMVQHSSTIPVINAGACVSCGLCKKECPGGAITLEPVVIDPLKCVGCGKCIGVCPQQVFSIPWGSTGLQVFQERLVEYARMISDGRKMVYINVIDKVSRLCDCDKGAPPPFAAKIGIVGGTDMVAVDKASLDLVNRHTGFRDAFLKHTGVSGDYQLEYAERIGLSSREYELIEV